MDRLPPTWADVKNLLPFSYRCGHCGEQVASEKGYSSSNSSLWVVRLCVVCNRPTYFEQEKRFPGDPFGDDVRELPPDVEAIYREIRGCMSVSAYTSAVLTSRKLLMHIAVSKGAGEDLSFSSYVDYLVSNNYAPAGASEWVKHIKEKGNEANHEIVLMDQAAAEELIIFLAMLMKFIYEFPERMKKKVG